MCLYWLRVTFLHKMLTILACGDVGVKRASCDSMFAGCAAVLRGADICFAQLETTISERGEPVPNAKLAMRSPPAMAHAVREAGIGVMSLAGNHCEQIEVAHALIDAGADAILGHHPHLLKGYRLPDITRRTGLAKLSWSPGAPLQAGFLPAWIDDDSLDSLPHMLQAADARFADLHALPEQSSRDAGLRVHIEARGDELLLGANA
jgi:hypothetical protein